jgi:excisionase family DNA binding protein
MKIKPYIPLDREVLNIIEKVYKVRDIDEILNRFCFSNPQLESHQCNNLSLTKGEPCEHCNNVPENFNCQVTCDISHVCHAAYACRLGIGGKDILKAVRNNSEMNYEKLLEEIYNSSNVNKDMKEEIIDDVDEISNLECSCEDNCVTIGEEEMSEMDIITEETEKPKIGRPVNPDEELLTCKQVADILGCSLMNIYQKIAAGRVRVVGNPRKRRIPISEVERLKSISRTFKKKNAVAE